MNRFKSCLVLTILILLFAFAPTMGADFPIHFFTSEAPSMGTYQQEFFASRINVDPELTRGYKQLVKFNFKEALKILEKASSDTKKSNMVRSEAYTYLGYVYINTYEIKKSEESLRSAIEMNPKNALAYFFMANVYFLRNKFDRAKEYLHRAIEIRPNFVAAMRMLAEIYKDEHNLEQAKRYYGKTVELLPNSGYYRYKYYKIADMMKDYQEVEKTLKALIDLQPGFLLNYIRLGENYIKMKRYNEALEVFNYVLEKDSGFSRAYEGKAKVYLRMQDYERAYNQIKKAEQIAPDNAYVKALLADIREKKSREIKRIALTTFIVLLILATLVSLGYFIVSHRRKKHVLQVAQFFNKSVDEIYDLDALIDFILNFFLDIGSSSRGIFMLFNRQNNQLSVKETVGFADEDVKNFSLFAGIEITNWLSREKRFILSMEEIEEDPDFSEVFPSLKERLKDLEIHYLILIREKNHLEGLVGVDHFRTKERILPYENELLMPLGNTSARILSNLSLYETAVSDETTGLYNKRYFIQNLKVEINRSQRYNQPLSIITFDIDNFKSLNDTYGHPQGDRVLGELGEIVRKNFRDGIDIAARTGGEEFSVILPATDEEKTITAAQRLRTSVQNFNFSGFPKDNPRRVTISVGAAVFPVHARGSKELIEKADQALYLAKRTGKNKVCLFGQDEKSEGFLLTPDSGPLRRQKPVSSDLLDDSGLFTRSYFDERYTGEVRRSERSSRSCSLLMMKADVQMAESEKIGIFKKIAKILRVNLRRGIDVPARYDQDTITVLLPETDHNKAAAIARRLKMLIDKSIPLSGEKRVTFSIGVSNYPNLGKTEESFMESARQALKICQNMGGDKALIATPL